jgi:chromosome segregation ATPase
VSSGEEYRLKAAELRAKALRKVNPDVQAEFEGLAAAYMRLAEQAERNKQLDLTYETPPPKEAEPDA